VLSVVNGLCYIHRIILCTVWKYKKLNGPSRVGLIFVIFSMMMEAVATYKMLHFNKNMKRRRKSSTTHNTRLSWTFCLLLFQFCNTCCVLCIVGSLRFLKLFGNITKEAGESVKLKCEVTGDPPPSKIRWFKNEAPVIEEKGRLFTRRYNPQVTNHTAE
jgi:hypothetical protein